MCVLLHTDLNEAKIESELFFKDDATVFDAVETKVGGNGGLLERWGFTGAGCEVPWRDLYVMIYVRRRGKS